jgi:hypothetical protein
MKKSICLLMHDGITMDNRAIANIPFLVVTDIKQEQNGNLKKKLLQCRSCISRHELRKDPSFLAYKTRVY